MATSKLQRIVGDLLDKSFPQFRIIENYRPDWLISSNYTKLELDFYIEELKIAFEIQGQQHYSFIPFFHKTQEDFDKRKQYDIEKRDLCYGRKIKLIEIHTEVDIRISIKNIIEEHRLFKENENIEFIKPVYFSKKKLKKIKEETRKNTKASPISKAKSKEEEAKKFYLFAKRRIKENKSNEIYNFNFQFLNREEQSKIIKLSIKKWINK